MPTLLSTLFLSHNILLPDASLRNCLDIRVEYVCVSFLVPCQKLQHLRTRLDSRGDALPVYLLWLLGLAASFRRHHWRDVLFQGKKELSIHLLARIIIFNNSIYGWSENMSSRIFYYVFISLSGPAVPRAIVLIDFKVVRVYLAFETFFFVLNIP